MECKPIVVFAYNRLHHLKETISSLAKNDLAKESELYVVSDGNKDEKDMQGVCEVRDYIKKIKGFKRVHIIKRKKNYGLARNIVMSLNSLFCRYDALIVLEDDIVTNRYFLSYMNYSLEKYEKKPEVMAVSGYTVPFCANKLPVYFFLPWFSCWGWGTWKERWAKYKKNTTELIRNTGLKTIKKINMNNTSPDMWNQVLDNYLGRINTWAIYFYTAIINEGGMVLYSRNSFCNNIGLDGSGQNCGVTNIYDATVCGTVFNERLLPDNCFVNYRVVKQYEMFQRGRYRGKRRVEYMLLSVKTILFYIFRNRCGRLGNAFD